MLLIQKVKNYGIEILTMPKSRYIMDIINPISIFEFIIEELKEGHITIEQANHVGANMPDGFNFQIVNEDEL